MESVSYTHLIPLYRSQAINSLVFVALGRNLNIVAEACSNDPVSYTHLFYNTKETYLLAQRQGVEMPITEHIYQMLFCGKSAQEVALSLLGRERKGE